MNTSTTFARRVFFWSGIYGLIVLLPMYFIEDRISRDFPPALTHAENYYGFIGAALAWQLAFLAIARDVVRYRLMMLPAIAAKLVFVATMATLYLQGRVVAAAMAPVAMDLLIGLLFIAAFLRTRRA